MTLPHSSRTAPVLLCPDVLLEIFNHLQPERSLRNDGLAAIKQRRVCRGALRACALTCRGLSDLALDVLWRTLDDIQPIIKLLSGNKRCYVLNLNIKHETWLKCQRYAARVRELGLCRYTERIHPSVWTFLAMKYQGSPLFPRLCRLDAYSLALNDLSPLLLLLTPSLRSLSISFAADSGKGGGSDSRVSAYVLQHVTRVAPNIKSCLISGRHGFITRTHLSMLQKFSGLRELSLETDDKHGFDMAMLCQLSTTTSLDALTMTITSLDPSCLQLLRDKFTLLRRFKLKGRVDNVVALVLACRLPLLHSLTLEINNRAPRKDLVPGLGLLSQHPDLAKSLTHIRLELFSGTRDRHVQRLVEYLDALLPFSKLEHCDLDFGAAAPSICDGDLIELGDAWPNLQHLNVRGSPNVESDEQRHNWQPPRRGGHATRRNTPHIQHPTILGLTELARRCPTLRYVHLVTLNADLWQGTLPQGSTASRSRVSLPHPSLRELLFDCVDNAPTAGSRCALVKELDDAFPVLDISRSKAECANPKLRKEWRRIMLLLRALRYRRDPNNLGPNAHRQAAATAQFAASRQNLEVVDTAISDAEEGEGEGEWNFDSDDGGNASDGMHGSSYDSESDSARGDSEPWESDF